MAPAAQKTRKRSKQSEEKPAKDSSSSMAPAAQKTRKRSKQSEEKPAKDSSSSMAPAAQKTRKRSKQLEEKPAKDPAAPKKPAGGAYGVFLAENREEFMKTAGRNVADVSRHASSRWKEMSEEDKEQYQKKYQEKLEAYQVSKKEYKESQPEGRDHPSTASIATRDTSTPKKRSAKRSASDEQQGSEPSSSTKESRKDNETKSKDLGPMELARQASRRRCLHQRAQKLGLLEKMFVLSKELSEVKGVNDVKILQMLQKSAGMTEVAKRRLLGEV